MKKEEKAKIILDYDEYQELLERARWSDLKTRFEGYIDFASKHGNNIYREVMDSLDKSLKTIPALSFWNYFTGKADRAFCDKIRTCVGSGITNAFSRILEQTKL